MKTTTKRFLSMLMAVIMMVSLLPISAFADEKQIGGGASLTEPLDESPEPVGFVIQYMKENAEDENQYDVAGSYEGTGMPGELVSDNMDDAVIPEYDGFTVQGYSTDIEIAEDGSTVVEIRYSRNMVKLTFTVGDVVRTVYAKCGTQFVIPEMVSAEEDEKIDWGDTVFPETVPLEDASYSGTWETEPTANYTVIFWAESSVEDQYSYLGSDTREGNVGEEIVLSGSDLDPVESGRITESADKYHLYGYDTGKTVSADGSTVVNVKFERNSYSIKFYSKTGPGEKETVRTCGLEEHTHTSKPSSNASNHKGETIGCYTSTHGIGYYWWSWDRSCGKEEHKHSNKCNKDVYLKYTINAKWGQNVLDQWPGDAWYVSYDASEWQASIRTMPIGGEDFYKKDPGSGNSTATYKVAKIGQPNQFEVHHKDTVSGSRYTVTDAERYAIMGFTYLKGTDNGETYNGSEFYYSRNKYTVTFVDTLSETQDAKEAEYEAKYGGLAPKIGGSDGWQHDGYTFAGWYLDRNGDTPVDLGSATMPAYNLPVYAIWIKNPIHLIAHVYDNPSVTYILSEGGVISSGKQEPGGQSFSDPTPKEGDTFLYWKMGNSYVDSSARVYTDNTHIYAVFASSRTKDITINYVDEDNNPLHEPTVIKDRTIGSTYTAQALTIANYTPTVKSHSILVADDNYEYTFVYKGQCKYKVEYYFDGNIDNNRTVTGRQGIGSEVTYEQHKLNPIPTGYIFDHTNGEPDNKITVTDNPANNVLKIFYITRTYTVKWVNYDNELLEQDDNVEYGATPSYDGDTPTKPADAQYTYTFAGWDPEVSAVTGNVTYKAQYDKTTNKYTVKYLPGTHGTFTAQETPDVAYGSATPAFQGEITGEADYSFAGWNPEIENTVLGNATYTATWTKNNYATIKLTAPTGTKKYDGTALAYDALKYPVTYTIVSGALVEGDTVVATASGSITDVGSVATKVAEGYKVMRGANDVTKFYAFEESVDGLFTVEKRTVTLQSGTSTRAFNNLPLTNETVTVGGDGFVGDEGATYSDFASITAVGSVKNDFKYELKANTKAGNYDIQVIPGTLTITNQVFYRLTIHYVDNLGNTVAPDYIADYTAGTTYARVSPAITGFTPDQQIVNGTMPAGNVEITVTYVPGGKGGPGPDPDPYDITEITDDDIPLAFMDGTHQDSLWTFLFTTIAMISQGVYASKKKKYQEAVIDLNGKLVGEEEKED